jgi:GNAT superfamily N-acetyltransferase
MTGAGQRSGPVIRPARPGDGAGLAKVWTDAGRNFAGIDPRTLKLPETEGLTGWFEASLGEQRPPESLWLVAESGGDIAGFVSGTVEPPREDAHFQLVRDLSRSRLSVGVLAVAQETRRAGVGTALMTAIEAAARDLGAEVVLLDTNQRSPLSVPFYENRMGYERQAIIFRKEL